MFFSSDPDVFTKPTLCNLQNGTTIYLNPGTRHNLACSCAVPWRADPDFGSDGIITVYLVLSGLTVFVSLIPVIYQLVQSWRAVKHNFWHWIDDIFTLHLRAVDWPEKSAARASAGESVLSGLSEAALEKELEAPGSGAVTGPAPSGLPAKENRFVLASKTLLIPLCTVQIFAGIIWVIWAFRNWSKLTYYHEQFVVNFWWLTLTSVWIARLDLVSRDSTFDAKSNVQRFTLIVSVILASVLQILVAQREHNDWDPFTHGHCYLTRDGDDSGGDLGQNIFWAVGTIVYGLALLLTFLPFSRNKWDRWMSSPLDRNMVKVGLNFRNAVASLRLRHSQRKHHVFFQRVLAYGTSAVQVFVYGTAWLLGWCLVQFMSIWGAGNGSVVVETGAYIIFVANSMYSIVAMKIDNTTMMVGHENADTLGPVVLVLMSVGVFYAFYTR